MIVTHFQTSIYLLTYRDYHYLHLLAANNAQTCKIQRSTPQDSPAKTYSAADFDFTDFDMWWDDMHQGFLDGELLVSKSYVFY